MATLMMSPSRYVAVIVLVMLIFNMYLFQRVIRLNSENEAYRDMSLHTSLPTATLDTKVEPATVTVTQTVTATTTITPDDKTLPSKPQTQTQTQDDDDTTSELAIKPLLAHQAIPDFPAKVWHKCGPKGVSDHAQELMKIWLQKNPQFRHEILTDESADQYVRERYAYWPEVLETYLALTVPILKADFLRVLILYADGGIWSDLDVVDDVPVGEWIPKELAENTAKNPINVVVGIEFPGHQFTSWTVMAKPHLQHFKAVIEYVMKQLKTAAIEHHVPISGITKLMIVGEDVVKVTGPQAITVALLESLSKELGAEVSKNDLNGLKEPKLLGDILVLPQAAFAALQGGKPTDQGPYLVSHEYSGSWKNDKGGEEGQNPPAAGAAKNSAA
ncbi:hypothetical protein BJY01DRAFT_123796 [Aspergillus pseudoustus]|uniref:Nucleotide-diphospho-sugar transferase n=1 Tax=Aspergillus pseudoustus TaxID=1810923 RepID=A0ABR4IPB9_9EURO